MEFENDSRCPALEIESGDGWWLCWSIQWQAPRERKFQQVKLQRGLRNVESHNPEGNSPGTEYLAKEGNKLGSAMGNYN